LYQPFAPIRQGLKSSETPKKLLSSSAMTSTEIRAGTTPPGPKGHRIVGSLPEFRKDPLNFMLQASEKYGDIVSFKFGIVRGWLINDPDYIKYVLQDNHKNYSKETRGFITLRQFLGMGLLTADGDTWLRHRRIAQPAFHRQKIVELSNTMVRCAQDTAKAWEKLAQTGKAVDISEEMMQLTLRIIGETMLSTDVSNKADTIGKAVDIVLREAIYRIQFPFTIPMSLPIKRNRELSHAMQTLDGLVFRMIAERRKSQNPPNDLLSMLLNARDENTDEGMNDKQLRDEVMTIFLAGHETTANALSWTFYLLSKYPEAARKLRAELAEKLGGRAPTADDVPKLRYTTMVLEESMRLYPPAWVMTRAPRNIDEIGGYKLEPGTYVFISPWVTQRKASLWEDPEGFDPERFAPEKAANHHRFAYFPFGGGPRICIGNAFAMMEATLILAILMQQFRPDLMPGHKVELEPMITLRPKDGIWMKIRSVQESDRAQ
jgi:cytochrome P450